MKGKRQRLAVAIDAALQRWCAEPFVWGRSDCLLELSNIIHEARGYDPAAPFRGRYKSAIGAVRVTRAYLGFAGALASMALEHGWEEIDPKRAAVGDIGVITNEKGPRCGVIRHHTLWVGRGMAGFTGSPTSLVVQAWRVT